MYKGQKLKKCPKCGADEGLIKCPVCHNPENGRLTSKGIGLYRDWQIWPKEKPVPQSEQSECPSCGEDSS